jgi:hypothetical protein
MIQGLNRLRDRDAPTPHKIRKVALAGTTLNSKLLKELFCY